MSGLTKKQVWVDRNLSAVLGVPEGEQVSYSEIQKKLRHSPHSFFVGTLEDRVVSTVMVGYDGHRGWVYLLAVRPEVQRKGIGRQMMEHAENWLREHGCVKVKLQVEESRGDVTGFYRKLGYEVQPLVSMGKWFRASES